jgi:hypothetical protein
MKSLLSLVLVGMMGAATQVMAAPTDMVNRTDRVQFSKPAVTTSAVEVQRVVQRNDRVKFKKLVVTEINKFSERQDSIREQRNDRVSITRSVNS